MNIYRLPDDGPDDGPPLPTGLPIGRQLAATARDTHTLTLGELETFLTAAYGLGLTSDTPVRARPTGRLWGILSWLHLRAPHPVRIETARRTPRP